MSEVTFILRASQDAKRAIKYSINDAEGAFSIFDIEKSINMNEIFNNQINENDLPSEQIAECVFFPTAFGYVIAIAYKSGKLRFIKENPSDDEDNGVIYSTIDFQIGCPDNDMGPNLGQDEDQQEKNDLVFPYFEKNLRISLFPPELNIGFISKDTICIFFVDFQTSFIKLIPIRRYYTPNTLWFDFTHNYSIWRCTIKKEQKIDTLLLEMFDLNSFKHTDEIQYESPFSKEEFVDASISPIQFDGTERIVILQNLSKKADNDENENEEENANNGDKITVIVYNIPKNIISNVTNNGKITPKLINSSIAYPISIEWSPLGSRIAIFSATEEPKIFIETSYNIFKERSIKYLNEYLDTENEDNQENE